MKKQLFSAILLGATLFGAKAQLSPHDLNAPFGWATCTSLITGDTYPVTGGNDGSLTTLKSNGGDMKAALNDAIQHYDIVVLDGSDGDFTISSSLTLKELRDKTIVDSLIEERQRESRLTLLGIPVLRFTYEDLSQPARLDRLLKASGITPDRVAAQRWRDQWRAVTHTRC